MLTIIIKAAEKTYIKAINGAKNPVKEPIRVIPPIITIATTADINSPIKAWNIETLKSDQISCFNVKKCSFPTTLETSE